MKISNCLPVFKSQTVHARYNFLKLHLVFTVTQLILQSCYKLLLNLIHSFALSFYMSGCFSIVASLLSKFIRHFLWFLLQQSADSGKRKRKGQGSCSSLLPPYSPDDNHTFLSSQRTFSSLFFFQNMIRWLPVSTGRLCGESYGIHYTNSFVYSGI